MTSMGFITVTGADEATDVAALSKLDAEIGLLYTATPEGRRRYPSRDWIAAAANKLPRLSIHVCGSTARQQLHEHQLPDIVLRAQRIQVNGAVTLVELQMLCARYPKHTIITQHNLKNIGLASSTILNHARLQDASGGAGILAAKWQLNESPRPFGFAGGLSPENLAEQMPQILKVARPGWWIDLESSLREDDAFSVERARRAVDEFHRLSPIVVA